MAELPASPKGIVLTHFIVSHDVERSRRFYTEVLGGRVVFGPEPINVALSNSWIVINAGGGPTDDKPTVTLETPRDPDRVSSFLNIRVKDIDAVYAEWSARGAQFLTPPKQHKYEKRCYIRDPDVSVEVERYRPVFIMGEVGAAGQYSYVPGMTAQKAIAAAGGFSPRAYQGNVDVTRTINGKVMTGRVMITDPLLPGDTIYVRERLF